MLKLYNKEHKAIGVLTNLKDYKIEYLLSGEDLLEFSLSICDENIHLVEEEGYVRNKNNEYVIKAIDPADNFKRFTCNVNVEAIVGKAIANFDTSNNKLDDTIKLAIAGTGWTLVDSGITKRRTVRLTNTNALEVLREVRKVFSVDFRYDAINKKIYVYEKFGEDKGVYFSDELNLKSLSIPSDTYDYVTRLYPYGKDGLTIAEINNGKEYIENFQYSNKIIELIWQDNRYTDVNSLKEDAEAKLEELSKPNRTYQTSVIDLAKQSEEYSYLDFFLGDTVTLLSKSEKFRDKQRIVKYIEYPDNPSENTCELGNTILTFEELQQENEYKNQTVDNITTGNGTVNGEAIDGISTEQIYDFEASVGKIVDFTAINADITNLKAENVTITGKLSAIEGEFGTLKANVGVIDKLVVNHTAEINNLIATKADITDLTATNIKFDVASGGTLDLQTLISRFVTGENGQFINISSSNSVIANATIKNAMIESLSVDKLLSGRISTNKFTVASDDGGIEIVGATQQFKDKNNKVRIQMGQDTQGNFNFILRGEDGTTTLIDHTGIKEKAIADDLIKENMVAADAIGEKQINYSSLITGLNKDTNTQLIKASKVAIDLTGQSLEVSFNSLKSNVDGIQVGGRNLLLNSNKTVGESYSREFVQFADVAPIFDNYGLIEYTISFDIKSKDTSKSNSIQVYGQNGSGARHNFNKTITVTTEWQRKYVVVTPKLSDSSLTKTMLAFYGTYNTGNIPIIRNVKIEKGNKATDYTVAPEDVEQKIESNTTSITVAQGKIEGLISENSIIKGDVTTISDKYTSLKATVDGINTTVASHTSSIGTINTNISNLSGKVTTVENNYTSLSQNLEGFKTTVGNTYSTKSELSNLSGTVSSINSRVSTAESSITQLNNKIDLKVEATDISTAINNLSIGGRNLLRNSNIDRTTTRFLNIYVKDILSSYIGKEICVSFDCKINSNGIERPIQMYKYQGSGVSIGNSLTFTPTKEYKRFTLVTKVVESSVPSGYSEGSIGFYDYAGNNNYTIKNVKIELGNKPTDWTPAPEDIQSQLETNTTEISSTKSKVASIETNLGGIKQRVSVVEQNQTSVNGKVTSLETWKKSAESKLTKEGLTTIISNHYTTSNDVNGIISSKGYITQSQVQQTVDGLQVKISQSGGYNNVLNGKFKNGFNYWKTNKNAEIVFNNQYQLYEGTGILVNCKEANAGIFQIVETIPGETYSFSMMVNSEINMIVGFEDVNCVARPTANFKWTRYTGTFVATKKQHAIVAYSYNCTGIFYISNICVTKSSIPLQFSPHSSELYDGITTIDKDGIEIDSTIAKTKNRINHDGLSVIDKITLDVLLKATSEGVIVKGGKFVVEDKKNGNTVLWGRDLNINGQRALVGTNSTPESALAPNTLYINYHGDFVNGTLVDGAIFKHQGRPVLSQSSHDSSKNGHLRLNNGLMMQWGTATVSIQGGDYCEFNITFPVWFNNKCDYIGINIDAIDEGNSNLEVMYVARVKRKARNGAVFNAKNITSDKWGSKISISWFAIGN